MKRAGSDAFSLRSRSGAACAVAVSALLLPSSAAGQGESAPEPVSIAHLIEQRETDLDPDLSAVRDFGLGDELSTVVDPTAFLSIDCIPDVIANIIPIGATAFNNNYDTPWTPAEGFLAGADPNGSGVPASPGSPLSLYEARMTIFAPSTVIDDPMTMRLESDALSGPDPLSKTRWTFRYYRESGAEGGGLNSPHLPRLDPTGPVTGDNSAELIAKFQYVGADWFNELCIGFDDDATPVIDMAVANQGTCIPFTEFGDTCMRWVAVEHEPLIIAEGECYWFEFVPEFAPSVPIETAWVLSGSAGAQVFQDAQSWRDASDPNSGFVNGTQGSPDYAVCFNIDLAESNPDFPAVDPVTGEPIDPIDVGQNLSGYIEAGCSSVVCDGVFGENDTCGEAIPITDLGGLGAPILGNTFCSNVTNFDLDSIPDPAPTSTGRTVGAFGLVSPLWYTFQGTGNDMTIDLCSPGTDISEQIRRDWWIAVYCGVSCGIGQLYPIASASSLDGMNPNCPIVYDPNGPGDLPSLTVPTTSGQTYRVCIFSEMGEGNAEFVVTDTGVSADPAELVGQCQQCDLNVSPGVPPEVTLVEAEDELSLNSPTDGACEDGFGYPDSVSWREQTRANDFCFGTASFTNAEYDAWKPEFTPLNGSPQGRIFLPNFDGPGEGGHPDSSYDLSLALQPLSVPFRAVVEGRVFNDGPGPVGDYEDYDYYGFTVSQPAIVRTTILAETPVFTNVESHDAKVDPITGLPNPLLGFDCRTSQPVSDGLYREQCQLGTDSTVVFPGRFYTIRVSPQFGRAELDCLDALGRRYFLDVEVFNCPPAQLPPGQLQFESESCRRGLPIYDNGQPIFEDDPNSPGSPEPLLWPNGNPRFVNLLDELGQPIPVFDRMQLIDPLTQQPQIDQFGEPVLGPEPGGGQFQTAFFGVLDANGDLQINQMTGLPQLEERPYFQRTMFRQAICRDTNRGCEASVEFGEDFAFDPLVVSDPALPFVGTIGTDPVSQTRPRDEDWLRFIAPQSGTIEVEAEFMADLFIEVFEDPVLRTEQFGLPSQCPGVPPPETVVTGCEPLFLVASSVLFAERNPEGGCVRRGGFTLSGLTPGVGYAIRVQLGEPATSALNPPFSPIATTQSGGAEGDAGTGMESEQSVDQYVLFVKDGGGGGLTCLGVADQTTTGATLPGQIGYGVPDGVADLDDLGYYLDAWLAGDPNADFTTAGATIAGQVGFGVPDGAVDLDDLGFFLGFWLTGCP